MTTHLTTFKVTVYGPESWCDPGRADALADLIASVLTDAAQEVADLAPALPDGGPVRVVVIEDLGPGPLMRNLRSMATSPAPALAVAR